MSKYLGDVLVVAGCGMLVWGAYALHPVAAIFTGGVILIILGVVAEMGLPGKVKR